MQSYLRQTDENAALFGEFETRRSGTNIIALVNSFLNTKLDGALVSRGDKVIPPKPAIPLKIEAIRLIELREKN